MITQEVARAVAGRLAEEYWFRLKDLIATGDPVAGYGITVSFVTDEMAIPLPKQIDGVPIRIDAPGITYEHGPLPETTTYVILRRPRSKDPEADS